LVTKGLKIFLGFLVTFTVLVLFAVFLMPTISTLNKITIHGSSLCSSALRFTEFPAISITTNFSQDQGILLSDIDTSIFPKKVQLFLQKRNRFIQDFQNVYPSLSSGQTGLHYQNMSITGTLVQVIPIRSDEKEQYICILVSEQHETLYLVFDHNSVLEAVYQTPWVSFGNCIIPLNHPDHFIDLCIEMNTTSGYFHSIVCKLQPNGLGFLKQELPGSFNSEVIRYSTKDTPFSQLFHPHHKDIFAHEINVIFFSPIEESLLPTLSGDHPFLVGD